MFRVRTPSEGWVGGPGLNTHYFLKDDNAYVQSGAQLAADRVHAAFTDAAGLWPPQVIHTVSPEVDVLDPINGHVINTFTVTPPAAIPGAGPDASYMAPATALLIKYLTASFIEGRRLQGRAFLSPLYSQMTDGSGKPTAPALAAGAAFGAALMDVGVEQVNLAVWRRERKAKPTATPPVTQRNGEAAIVVAVGVGTKFAVLRSRRD